MARKDSDQIMNTQLSRSFLMVLLVLCFTTISCISRVELLPEQAVDSTLHTRAYLDEECNSLYYYEDGACWIKPFEDPYKVDYFVKARDRYYSEQKVLSSDKIDIFPTHFALTLYPKSENDINLIMSMEDIKVSYIPFGFECISEEYVPTSIKSKTACNTYNNRLSPYSNMPVMFVVWPVELSLPEKIDYQVEYEGYLPDYAEAIKGGYYRDLQEIESIAIELAQSNQKEEVTRGQSYRTVSGRIKNSDNLLGGSVPVGNLKIRVQYGLNIIDNYTSNNGYITISGSINDKASVYVVFENDRWRLSRKGSLLAYSLLLGKLTDLWPSNNLFYEPTLTHNYLVVHRASNYFFNDIAIIVPPCNYSIRINMNEKYEPNNSYFTFVLGSPKIELSYFWAYNNGTFFYKAIHELAHFYHYLERDSIISSYNSVHQLIKESFAEFFAWYFSREYYKQMNGGVYNSSWGYNLGDTKQSWLYTDNSDYSPLFIDLIDDYNQYYERTPLYTYNNDPISDMGLVTVTYIALYNNDWESIKGALYDRIGIDYTSTQYYTFIAPYDNYFSLSQ